MMRPRTHRSQGPFCGACTTYKKPSTFDKYVTKFLGTANPIPNFEFADKYVKNNKQIKYFKLYSCGQPKSTCFGDLILALEKMPQKV